jgi:hypothetical protein
VIRNRSDSGIAGPEEFRIEGRLYPRFARRAERVPNPLCSQLIVSARRALRQRIDRVRLVAIQAGK